MMNEENEVKVIKANTMLQAKVGSGPLSTAVVDRMQKVMEENTVDFQPLAQEFLAQLDEVIQRANADGLESVSKSEFTAPVMQLKANASTFKYHLVGRLANIMLNFMENLPKMDKVALDIVSAHHTTLSAIVAKKMMGDGGEHGIAFENELLAAIERYQGSGKKP